MMQQMGKDVGKGEGAGLTLRIAALLCKWSSLWDILVGTLFYLDLGRGVLVACEERDGRSF